MDKRWFRAAGILLAALLIVSASTLTLLSTHEDLNQVPSAPDTSAQQSSSVLSILTKTVGGINSAERESEAVERRAGALSLEAVGGQESPSMPGPLGSIRPSGRVIHGPIPSALNSSAAHMTVDSQPASPGADPVAKILASGTLETTAMSLPPPSPTHGSEQFSKVSKLYWTVSGSASLETTVVPKPTWHPIRSSLFPIVPRAPFLLLNTSSPPAWRDGHSRPEASPPVALAPKNPLGLTIFPWMPNIPKTTEPLLPASSGRSGPDLTSQAFTVGSGSSKNTAALGTGSVAGGAPVLLLSSATSPSYPSSPYSPPSPSALILSSSLPPASLLLLPSPSSIPAPVSSVTTGARDPPKPSVSVTAPSAADPPIQTSNLASPMALRPSCPGPRVPNSLIYLPNLSLQHFSNPPSTPHSSGFTELSGGAVSTQSSTLPHPGQDVSLQDLSSSTPGPSHVTHSVTFRINSKCFTTAVWNLIPLNRRLLNNRLICYQLQLIYHEAFSSFKNISALLFRPGSTEVTASLVFGQPDPSALEILWALYRKVKASRWLLGHLSLADNSLSSDEYNMADLTQETINITFTLMRPFLPQLLLPGSQPFILLEKQILQLVTHEVSRFYKANPQDQPLLLFSNMNEWVNIYMEYKFKSPIPTHLRGLASYLAHHITDPTLQKSSMEANGEKAELALYETWLLILDHPYSEALENKTSSESQELRGLLTKWITSVLKPLHNFGQVVVEEFQQEPLIAKVQAAFFGTAPAQAIIQDCMYQALRFLQETEGLQLEMLIPALGTPSSRASRGPSHGFMLNLQLITSLLILAALGAAPHFSKKQTLYLS